MYLNKKYKIILVSLFLPLFLLYLHLVGEGMVLTVVHSMMNESNNIGGFIIKEGTSATIDCEELHKRFSQFIEAKNVVTDPIPLNDGSGLFERFVKIDKSIIDTSQLSWKDRMALSMSSTEPKCARSLGTFLETATKVSKP